LVIKLESKLLNQHIATKVFKKLFWQKWKILELKQFDIGYYQKKTI